jgi:GTPase SAR1 family protein
MNSMQTEVELSRWRTVLNWNKFPNFNNCHEISDFKEFNNNYCLTPELKVTVDNILLSLDDGGKEQLNRCIIGKPGSGKTSFVHYLMKSSLNEENITSKFYFHIFDINKCNTPEMDELIAEEVILAWQNYFLSASQGDVASRIIQQSKSSRDKCALFAKYFEDKRSLFSKKTLIFVIDETDTLEEIKVKEISKKIISIITPKEVKKWLMIRVSTLKSYSTETNDVFESFFPNQTNFSGANLWDIIDYRIKRTSGSETPKNPFSKKLTTTTLRNVFGGNIRAALGALEAVLKYSNLGGISPGTSEEFIQNFIDKAALGAVLRLYHLPNIYSRRFHVSQYPIVLDMLRLSRFGKNREKILRVLQEIEQYRMESSGIFGRQRPSVRKMIIPREEIELAINVLRDSVLFDRISSKEFELSEMGKYVAEICLTHTYRDACVDENDLMGDNLTPMSIALLNVTIEHETFMLHDYLV